MPDWMDAIERLQQLREAGTISTDEFEAEKTKILRSMGLGTSGSDENAESDDSDWSYEKGSGFASAPKFNPLVIIGMIVGVAAAGIIIYKFLSEENISSGYVSASALNCRSDTNENAKIIAKLSKNVEVTFSDHKGVWGKVETPEGRCWISKEYVSEHELSSSPKVSATKTLTQIPEKYHGRWGHNDNVMCDAGANGVITIGSNEMSDGEYRYLFRKIKGLDGKLEVHLIPHPDNAILGAKSSVQIWEISEKNSLIQKHGLGKLLLPRCKDYDSKPYNSSDTDYPAALEKQRFERNFDFKDYPARAYNGQPETPKFPDGLKEYFSGRGGTEDVFKGGSNFAGEMVVILVSCGTECIGTYVGNIRTGGIQELGVNGLDIEHYSASRLIRSRYPDKTSAKPRCIQEFYVWEDDGLQRLSNETIEAKCEP